MIRLYDHKDAFEAVITILTKSEGGRSCPPHNGIRWDFIYAENQPENTMYMIWPEFVDDNGDALDKGLFLEGTLKARMHIFSEDMVPLHAERISVGTKFYSVEGPKRVAYSIVTKITGLSNET
ncbi:MAG: hypothetical protein V7785_00110 [Bermanella sp.]